MIEIREHGVGTPGSWSGRTVIVTGSTKGIGRATAALFGAAGAHVVVHGRDARQAADVVHAIAVGGGRASAILLDLREAAAAQALIDHAVTVTGRVDVLVNNAGANVFRGTLAATAADWDDCLNLDLRAVWLCAQAAARVMRPGSAIVNVSSNHASSTLPGTFPYNVAKAGVLALTQSLAIELASRGIRANTVCPGYIDTPINDAYFATFDDPARARRQAEMLHPLRRIGTADEVARAIRFLASEADSGFTTGSTLTLDGGRSALMQDPDPSLTE
jgi:NAD(P)-dependent dehydrogenase (short-subunit alcohol dehydrogenase family)